MPAVHLPRRALALAMCLTLIACQHGDTASQMAAARQYREQGDLRSAIVQLKSVLQHEADNRSARMLLGESYLDQGDALSADKELRLALALGADSGKVSLMLGRALLQQGQYERLLSDIQANAAPAQKAALLGLRAHALLGLNRIEAARALCNEALQLQADAPSALLGLVRIANAQGQADTARGLLQRALAANPDDIDLLRYQSAQLRADSDLPGALAVQHKLLRRHPFDAQAYIDVANLHTDAGQFDQAHLALTSARKITGQSLTLYYADAVLAFRENKLPAALESVQRVLRLAPEHYPSVLLAGAVQSGLGDYPQAEQHLLKFLQAYPAHLYAGKLLAGVHLGAQHPGAALTVLTPLLARHPDDPELLALAGEAQLREHHFAQAVSLFEKASALQPQLPALHTGLGLSSLANGEPARAVAELERAASLEAHPAHSGALLVMAYLRANMVDKALAAVLSMEQQADSPVVQNLKGGILLAQHNLPAARASFERARQRDATYLPALANLAQLDTLEHKPAATKPRYLAALASAPRNTGIMEALSMLAFAQHDNAEAISWMEKARAIEPDAFPLALRLAQVYLRAGEPRKALLLARKLQAGQADNPVLLAVLGQAWLATGNLAEAAASYHKWTQREPDALAPLLRLASVYLAQGRNQDAGATLHKALALAPDSAEARIMLVNLLFGAGNKDAAMTLALQARTGDSRNALSYKLEGDIDSAQGKHAEALKAYEHAHALSPGPAALIQIYGALVKLGRQGEADTRVLAWLAKHPADVAPRLHLASSLLVRNLPKAAIQQYELVLQHEPDNVAALNDLAWSSQRLGLPQALGYAQRAYQLAPTNPAILDTLGWIYLEQGALARATPLLQEASTRAPAAADIHFHYGVLLARTGDKRAARRELQLALNNPALSNRSQAQAALAGL